MPPPSGLGIRVEPCRAYSLGSLNAKSLATDTPRGRALLGPPKRRWREGGSVACQSKPLVRVGFPEGLYLDDMLEACRRVGWYANDLGRAQSVPGTMAHACFGIDDDIAWSVPAEEVPALVPRLVALR